VSTSNYLKKVVRAVMAQTPYRILRRTDANRFQAFEDCLQGMKDRGFSPRVVIDGGAHLGSFSLAAERLFPGAAFHLVEPQRACSAALQRLCRTRRAFTLHECALAEHEGQIDFTETTEPGTGAHVKVDDGHQAAVAVTARTLDALFGQDITPGDRALLKMDLQGYELHALQGGLKLLRSIEAILTEVSFYFFQGHAPPFADLMAFLDANDFQLYDIASLSGRTRDNRLKEGDALFVRKGTPLLQDRGWA
jgi:FkbM family methyltransferase